MVKIYQRFNTQSSTPTQHHAQTQNAIHPRQPNHPAPSRQTPKSGQAQQRHENKTSPSHKHRQSQPQPSKINLKDLLGGFIPTSVYNPETKKILGVFTSEDLMLAALILLLLENKEQDNHLLVAALAYVLLSDYIDFSSIGGILG